MRRTFTAEEKASVFELWKNGTGFSEIANILGSKTEAFSSAVNVRLIQKTSATPCFHITVALTN